MPDKKKQTQKLAAKVNKLTLKTIQMFLTLSFIKHSQITTFNNEFCYIIKKKSPEFLIKGSISEIEQIHYEINNI